MFRGDVVMMWPQFPTMVDTVLQQNMHTLTLTSPFSTSYLWCHPLTYHNNLACHHSHPEMVNVLSPVFNVIHDYSPTIYVSQSILHHDLLHVFICIILPLCDCLQHNHSADQQYIFTYLPFHVHVCMCCGSCLLLPFNHSSAIIPFASFKCCGYRNKYGSMRRWNTRVLNGLVPISARLDVD